MKIGIDVDDVVFEFTKTFLNFYFKKYGKSVKFEDVKAYYLEEILDLPLGNVMELIKDMVSSGVAEEMPICDYAKESILNLADEHDIIFLTSRTVRNGTLESLNKLFPNIKFRLIYSSNFYAKTSGKTKADICCEEGIDIMIEDSEEYANEIAIQGTKVFLLDKPWNQNYKEHENIFKVYHWNEILEKLNKEGKKGDKNKKIGVGFGVMILKEGKVLLGKRHEDPDKASSLLEGAGTWTMPGGKLHFQESFENGAKREVMEETGIKLNKIKVICVNNDVVEGVHFVTIGLFSDDFEGEPQVMEPDEITKWDWFDLDCLPAPVYFPSKKVLENYMKKVFYINENN